MAAINPARSQAKAIFIWSLNDGNWQKAEACKLLLFRAEEVNLLPKERYTPWPWLKNPTFNWEVVILALSYRHKNILIQV